MRQVPSEADGGRRRLIDLYDDELLDRLAERLAAILVPPPPPALIDMQELCRHVRASAPTVRKWIDAGRIPVIHIGDVIRFELDAVLAALRGGK